MKTDSNAIVIPSPLELPYVTVKFLPFPNPRNTIHVDDIPHTSVVMYNDEEDKHVIFYLQYAIKDFELKRMDRNTMRRYFYNRIINQITTANTYFVGNRGYQRITLPPSPRLARQFRQEQQATNPRDNVDDSDSIWNSLVRMVEYHNEVEHETTVLHIGTVKSKPSYNLKLNLGNYLTFTAYRYDAEQPRHREMIQSSCSGTCTIMGHNGYQFAVRTVLWWERGLNKVCGFLGHDALQTAIYNMLDKSFIDVIPNTSLVLADIQFNNQE